MEGFYGMRRKRNLDINNYQKDFGTQINWNNDHELEEGEEYYYEENEIEDDIEIIDTSDENVSEGAQTFFLNGKPFIPKVEQRKQSFSDTHIRVTTYFEKNVHQIVRMLQKQGQIESITKFVNDSMKEYLMNKFHNEE